MKNYTDKNGGVWDVEFWAKSLDPHTVAGSLVRNLADDLKLAVAGWKARGEEIERLREGVEIGHAWRSYAEAWEAYHDERRQWMPTRAEFGL
jgi:hypothetical protein